MTPAELDRRFPHQVALPGLLCAGRTNAVVHGFCKGLSLAPRGHAVRHDDKDYIVFCFAEAAHAELFRARFGGETIGPRQRGRGANWHEWRRTPAQSSI